MTPNKKKVLVTGGAGFIGSHIVRAYLEAGYEVVVVDNLSTGLQNRIPAGVRLYTADIRSDEMVNIVTREKPTVINHQAAQVSVPVSEQNPGLDADINVNGTINVLRAAVVAGSVKQFIFASSGGAVYGETETAASEKTTPKPLSVYGQSKLAAEGYVEFMAREHGMTHTILRYANVYGPEQGKSGEAGVVGIFIEKMLTSKGVAIHGDGEQSRDFVFVEDVALANVRATKKKKAGIFNIATGKKISVNELFNSLKKELQTTGQGVTYTAKRVGDVRHSVLSSVKARRILDWKSATNLKIGLRQTVQWWSQQITPSDQPTTITLVVPLYNEAKRVGRLLRALETYTAPLGVALAEIRLVSDGSTDKTVSVLREWRKSVDLNFKVRIMSYKQNRGRGYALRWGLKNIVTDYGVYIDGDLDIPLLNLERLAQPLSRGIDVVMGSKKMPGATCTQKRKLLRVMMGYGHTALAAVVLGQWRWDWQGGFKAFSKRVIDTVFPQLTINHWGFDMEVVFRAKKAGLSVTEVPLVWGAVSRQTSVHALADSLQAVRDMATIRKRWLVESAETFSWFKPWFGLLGHGYKVALVLAESLKSFIL